MGSATTMKSRGRTNKLQLWPRIVVVRSTTHAAAVMVKILSDGGTGKGHEEKEVTLLLDWLRSPTPADMARSRKIRTNQPPSPPRGKRTCRRALASDPKGVTLRQQVKEFPTEPLLSVTASSSVQHVVNSSVFHYLSSFEDKQDISLKDYIKSSLMLQYNKRYFFMWE